MLILIDTISTLDLRQCGFQPPHIWSDPIIKADRDDKQTTLTNTWPLIV